ncbi:hypothetical protein D3X12_15495 [Pseudomonas protegens]|jgi:hypothetical protein|uniref:DUF2190 family protein n=1 Tax=Pseudomonas protegens TaxID=380021 RepID=A0ABY2VGS3_9PSED|nr:MULTISPECIES: hypothetical protein [Pseudomonas]ASE24353.1 hypothetical protein CEP86_29285 [Pseudomonas protegens]QEZ52004.1 hypothetical protein D3X12_15495 [Pseudomonas protegens]QEZ55926.1 hypothetical protein D4N38_03980 [Pseudomonas protegens]QEZ63264.1 hypothetical protein D4N37_10820 [Pseudomonas protegens]QIC26849.1 hypothetical protein FQ342_00160 [Pseudomonas protegens]
MDEVKIGKNYTTISPLKGVVQIVAPAQNVAGVVIRTSCIASGKGTVNVIAGLKTPTGITDISQAVIFGANGNTASPGHSYEAFMPYPLFIPASQGLWVVGDDAGSSAIALTWDILS